MLLYFARPNVLYQLISILTDIESARTSPDFSLQAGNTVTSEIESAS